MKPDQSWRPDGRSADGYANHDRRRDLWAWEFLRRNPDYQEDYARWNSLPDAEDGGWSMKFDRPAWGDFESMKYFATAPDRPAADGETYGDYAKRTGEYPEPLERVLCQKWGLLTLSLGNPSEDHRGLARPLFVTHPRYERYAPLHLDCRGAKEIYHPWVDRGTCASGIQKMVTANVLYNLGEEDSDATKYLDTDISSPNYAVFAFDLREDPEVQTAEVLEILRGMRERKAKQDGGVKPPVMLRRLRVLDAVNAGMKQAVIANLLGVTDDTVSKDLKAAKALVDGGYRKLAMVE